jgi:hypothetical protein
MITAAPLQKAAAKPLQAATAKPLQAVGASLFLQRKCACGAGTSSVSGACEECSKKKMVGLQTKLRINEPGDVYEQEADRVAEQVLAKPAHPGVTSALPRIQRFSGQPSGQMGAAPPSVDRALASPGRPLEPVLRHNMERRFGHDFSTVRVHLGAAAEQSARDVNAHAYTVGHDIVFGASRFAPETPEGRRLIAHELTHVVQQSGANGTRVGQSHEKSGLSPVSITSITRRIQRNGDGSTDPVLEVEQLGDVWHLKVQGFTEAGAVAGYIWPSGLPPGVRIVPLVVVEKPVQVGLFELTGVTLKALDSMASPFASWFTVSGISWTEDDLKKLLDACDGGVGIWAKAKKANKGKDPQIKPRDVRVPHTDSLTGEITLDRTVDKCTALQQLIHELSNLSSVAEINKIHESASAGDVSRDEFIKRIEKIEYEVGVKNVFTAFDVCKDKWLCRTNIMEFARKAKDFEDYFKNFLKSAHKEGYAKQWDDKFKAAYDRKHP